MRLNLPEGITYLVLYFFATRNYNRLLYRFYFYNMPFAKALDYSLEILLFVGFCWILYKYHNYFLRLLLIGGIACLPMLL